MNCFVQYLVDSSKKREREVCPQNFYKKKENLGWGRAICVILKINSTSGKKMREGKILLAGHKLLVEGQL